MTELTQSVRLDRDGEIAVITIDNPPVNNISIGLRAALHGVFDRIAATAGVRAALAS